MIGRSFFALCCGYSTPAAALYGLTEQNGPYIWYGLIVGKWFFGAMVRTNRAESEAEG